MNNPEPYYINENRPHCDESYSVLNGPNGFECILTEPEDRNWYRDGQDVVNELNRLYKENIQLKEKLENLNQDLST